MIIGRFVLQTRHAFQHQATVAAILSVTRVLSIAVQLHTPAVRLRVIVSKKPTVMRGRHATQTQEDARCCLKDAMGIQIVKTGKNVRSKLTIARQIRDSV